MERSKPGGQTLWVTAQPCNSPAIESVIYSDMMLFDGMFTVGSLSHE